MRGLVIVVLASLAFVTRSPVRPGPEITVCVCVCTSLARVDNVECECVRVELASTEAQNLTRGTFWCACVAVLVRMLSGIEPDFFGQLNNRVRECDRELELAFDANPGRDDYSDLPRMHGRNAGARVSIT